MMNRIILCCISLFLMNTAFSQTYTHPNAGLGGEWVGNCLTNTCSGTYYDNGGSGGNYSHPGSGVTYYYRTFCPNTDGQCMRVCFSSIDMSNTSCGPPPQPCDALTVINGSTQNDAALTIINSADDGTTPCFTATSTNGCLSFQLRSVAGAAAAPGWAATFSCTACAANTTGNSNTDACSSTPICANASFTGTSTGPGTTSDGCTGCNTSEHYTNWYYFCISANGVLDFDIKPNPTSQDYDFALYGPGVSCGSLGSPIRCSYYAGTGWTGLSSTESDNSESAGTGNSFTDDLNVTAGQCYYLMVSKWDAGGNGFDIDFTQTTASLDCIILPVELIEFNATANKGYIDLDWRSASETDNAYYIVEKSDNGIDYTELSRLSGQNTTNETTQYFMVDNNPFFGNNYYKLSQVDVNGVKKELRVKNCIYEPEELFILDYIRVFDLSGKMILEEKYLGQDINTLYTQFNLSSGLYLMQLVDTRKNTMVQKYFQMED